MDATAMALPQHLRFPVNSCPAADTSSSRESRTAIVGLQRRRVKNRALSSGFCDRGHLQYYNSSFDSSAATGGVMMSGKEKSLKKTKKKQLKLVKGLSKDLSTFSQMGFGLGSDGALLDQIKGNMITEATQLLLEQLQKVKAEEKEQKRRMKEEKARSKAAARMQLGGSCKMSSSSSSSESSDSECGEVVDMSSLKRSAALKAAPTKEEEEATSPYPAPIIPTLPSVQDPSLDPPSVEGEVGSDQPTSPSNAANIVETKAKSIGFVAPVCSKKIEVCMGGKCKKSGAEALLAEFQRAVGVEGAVSGCKCMGKCRDGPNVKVVNEFDGGMGPTAATTMATNSLCIGVGLEDVSVIVANFIDDHQNQQQKLGFAAA